MRSRGLNDEEDLRSASAIPPIPTYGSPMLSLLSHPPTGQSPEGSPMIGSYAVDAATRSKPKNFEENTLLNLLGHYNRLFRSLTTEVHAVKYNIAEKRRSRIEYQINIARSNEIEIQLEKTTSGGLREATFAGQMQHTGPSPAFHPLTASPHENAVVTRRDDTDTNDEEDIAPSSTPAVIPSSKSLILDRQKIVDKIDPSEDALNQEEEPAENNSWHDAPCAPIFYPVNLKAQAYDR